MYGTGYNNWVLFHANRYGRADMRSSRARIAKMNLLSYAESLVARPFSMGREAPPFVGATPATLGDKRRAVALGKGRPPLGRRGAADAVAAPRDEAGAGAAAVSSGHGGGDKLL